MQSLLPHFHVVVFAAIVATLVTALLVGTRGPRDPTLQELRASALEIFRSVVIESSHAKYSLHGSTATIAKQEESYLSDDHGASKNYTLTLFVRNEFNEYFLFKSTQPKPYLKHISHVNAKVILKHDYIPPHPEV